MSTAVSRSYSATLSSPNPSRLIYNKGTGSASLLANGEAKMIEGLLQPTHLLVILAVALFIFGPKKLPELGQGLGKGIRSFRDSMKAASEDLDKPDSDSKK